MELLKGPAAVKAGIVYLQNETHEFQVKESRRKWSVFGSPVRSTRVLSLSVFNLVL